MAAKGELPPLFDAAQGGDLESVRTILDARGDAGMHDGPFSWTALHYAAGYASAPVMDELLSRGVAVDVRASDGETPMHIAAQSGSASAVRHLTSKGADVNATNEDGETPLHTAVAHIGGKDTSCISTLLDLRADPTVKDNDGHDAFAHAVINTNRPDEIREILGKNGAPPSLIKVGEDVTKDMTFAGALGTACHKGKLDLVKQLLPLTPNSAVAAQQSLVPAATGGHVEVIELLVASRADLSSELFLSSETTPLIAAAEEKQVKMVKWLLAEQVDPSGTSRDGASALMAASMRGCTEAVSALLSARADVNHQALEGGDHQEGWTALMIASQEGRANVARQLLDAGAQLDATNVKGVGARDLALANGQHEMVKLLDTRSKLNNRKAKASAAKGNAADDQAAEDTRDVEALLSALGEPTKSSKKASTRGGAGSKAEQNKEQPKELKAENKKKAKKKAAPEDTAAAAAAAVPASEAQADTEEVESAAPISKCEAHVPCTSADATVDVKAPLPKTKGQKNRADKNKNCEDNKNNNSEDKTDRCSTLKKRLQEIDSARAAFDKEELAIRREIMTLERP